MRVEVALHEDLGRREIRRLKRSARRMMKALLPGGRRELSIALIGVEEMKRLNLEYLGRDEETDVLAFPQETVSGTYDRAQAAVRKPEPLGDIVICLPVAARNAALRNQNLFDELELLIAHGLIHILGGEHDTSAGSDKMEAMERALVGRSIID